MHNFFGMPSRFSARLKLRVSRFPLFCISYLHAMRSKSPAPGLSGRNYPSARAINKNASQMPPANFHSKGRLEVGPIIQKWARISNFPACLEFPQMTARTSGSFEESLIRALKRDVSAYQQGSNAFSDHNFCVWGQQCG